MSRTERIMQRLCTYLVFIVLSGISFNVSAAISSFQADPSTVVRGGDVVLSWVSDDSLCRLFDFPSYQQYGGDFAGSDDYTVTNLTANKNFILFCGSSSRNLSITVIDPPAQDEPPVVNLSLTPMELVLGENATLSWTVAGAETCFAESSDSSWAGPVMPADGSRSVTPLAVGTHTYGITCENAAGQVARTATLTALNPNVSITHFSISPASVTVGQSAVLTWKVENGSACTATGSSMEAGNWVGGKSGLEGVAEVTPTAPGNHTYTLTCTRGSNSDSKSVTLEALFGTAEITSFQITSATLPPSKEEDRTLILAAGGRVRTLASVKHIIPGSCTLNGIPYAAGQTVDFTFDQVRDDWTLTCDGYDGTKPTKVLPIRVVPAAKVVSFTSSKIQYELGEPISLSWQTESTANCSINGEPVATSASNELFPGPFGVESVTFTLACEHEAGLLDYTGNPATVVQQGRTVEIGQSSAFPVSGRIFGQMDLNMAISDSAMSLPTMRKAPRISGLEGEYAILGFSQPKSYWMWDFDAFNSTGKGQIYLGGSNLLALNSVKPAFRLFSPERGRIEGQHHPDDAPPLADHIGTFTSNGDGTYNVRFNYQIFFEFAGWPLAELYNQMSITDNGDGTWRIRTLDAHPDEITYFDDGVFDIHQQRVGSPPVNDGIPGALLPRSTDTKEDGSPAYNATFPARVSPGFSSQRMINIAMDGSGGYQFDCGGGVPLEFYSYTLRHNYTNCTQLNHVAWEGQQYPDVDYDGIPDFVEIGANLALPLATDRDSIADFLKPALFAEKRNFAGQIALGNGERVVVYSDDTILRGVTMAEDRSPSVIWSPIEAQWFGQPHPIYGAMPPSDIGKTELPLTDPGSGETLNYELGSLIVVTPSYTSSPKIRIYFNSGVPEGLTIFNITYEVNDERGFVWSYEQVDSHTVEVVMRANSAHTFQGVPTVLALAHTGANRDLTLEQLFDVNESGYQALLSKAANDDSEPDPEPEPALINSFTLSAATVTLDNSVNLLWQSENADNCALKQGEQVLNPALPSTGSYPFQATAVGTHTFELTCYGTGASATATTSLVVQEAGTPVDPNAITGTWTGNFSLAMRVAGSGTVLGDSHNNYWIWNFDEGWAQFGRTDPGEAGQGMLSVGFPFHVQDLGNADKTHDRALFTNNGDGTYTLHHGYQIYNPYVGNPRTDMTTTFRITRNGNQLQVVTLDPDGDGVPGLPVPNVFPMIVSPGIDGVLAQDGSLDPDPSEPGGPGGPGTGLIGLFQAAPGNAELGQPVTLTWQAVRANSCTASGDWGGAKATAGTETVTPASERLYVFTLTCASATETKISTVTVQVGQGSGGPTDPTDPTEPIDTGNGTANLSGVYLGEHMITMRGCPGTCVAGSEVVLGTGIKHAPWVWNFDAKTVLITGTTLTVGFNYEVQATGNEGEGDERLTASLTDNGDGTYTVQHGFQIYNPNVGSPRTDTHTIFRISRDPSNPNLLHIVTLDGESDGIAGTQIVGVFPMTVQPDFRGTARKEGSSSAGDGIADSVKEGLGLNPDAANADTDGDGIPDAEEIGPDLANPLDSDGDGIIDALEPGDAAHDAGRVAGLALMDGIPGRTQEGDPNAGSTVDVHSDGNWGFTGADTGLMQLAANEDNGGAIPDTTLGDAGLAYEHGYVQVQLASGQRLPAFGAQAAHAPYAAESAPLGPVRLTFLYEAALPAADKLLVYASAMVDGKERYTLLDASAWRRIDDHTLEVTVQDNGERDLDAAGGAVRTGIAPTANTLGGYDESSGNASGGGGGGSAGTLLLLALGLLVLAGAHGRRRAGGGPAPRAGARR